MTAFMCGLVLLMAGASNQLDVCSVISDSPLLEISEAPDDPALALYKSGYSAVLAKKWDDSRKKFQLILKKYPKSKYADQASYWLAYSYARQDSQKAAELYRQFLASYPESPYVGDAIADLERLGYAGEELPPAAPLAPLAYERAAAQYEQQLQLTLEQERMQAQMERTAEQMEAKERLLQDKRRQLEEMSGQLAERPHAAREGAPVGIARRGEKRDPELEIKVAAIQALSRNGEDAQAFETLKGVALDTTAHWEVRAAAIQGLHQFKERDLASLFQSLITDRNTELRQQAIMALARGGRNDAKTQSTLVKLAEDAHESRDIRMASLVALSELKYDGLMNTLEKIVTGDSDRKMRQEALVLVGRAGESDRARTVHLLKVVASNGSENRETRETAIYALSQIADRQVFDYLKSIASSEPDKKLRLTALYALAKRRSESPGEVEALMKDIALRTSEDRETRIAALFALADTKGDAPADLYKDLALQEKEEEIRKVAVHLLARSMKDKTMAFNTLSGIYGKNSSGDRQIKEAALYGIAELGGAQSVAFLKNVARSDQDHEMRRQAVYFLGSIGGDEAKAALIEILKRK
jgi:HEAT repeat protein